MKTALYYLCMCFVCWMLIIGVQNTVESWMGVEDGLLWWLGVISLCSVLVAAINFIVDHAIDNVEKSLLSDEEEES